MNILIIEDNPADARFVVELLKQCGDFAFNSTHTERLDKALQLLEKEEFDVVLLDLNLPDSRGLDGLKRITSLKSRVPVILLTGTDDEQLGVQALQKNAADYLVKGTINDYLLRRSILYAIERKSIEEKLRLTTEELRSANAFLQQSRKAGLNLIEDAVFARQQAEKISAELRHEIEERKKAEEEIKKSNEELRRFNKYAVGRELRMIELKKEINSLCEAKGEPLRYKVDFELESNKNEKKQTIVT